MWALIIVVTFGNSTGSSLTSTTVEQEFVTKELCVQAAKRVVRKLDYNSGKVRASECVFTGVR